MRKTILMLLLCAPLLWIAWQECLRIFNVSFWAPPTSAEGDDKPAVKPADLAEIQRKADEIRNLPDEVAGTIVRLDHPPTRNLGTGPIASAVLEHARERDKGSLIVDTARRKASEAEAKIEAARRRLRGDDPQAAGDESVAKNLDVLLDRYKELEVYDQDLLASGRAEAAWPELNKNHPASDLDAFYDRLNGWTPGRTDGESLDAVRAREHEAAYRKYVEAHRAAKGVDAVTLVGKARERLALWGRGADLADILEHPESNRARGITPAPIPNLAPEHKKRLDQIHAIVEKARDDPPPRFLETARHTLRTLCGDLLKPEDLDDDVQVIVDAQAEPELCPRKTLIINWKDQKRNALSDSGYNEFTIDPNKIESLVLAGGNTFEVGPNAKPLKGTDYSDAVQAFNDERAKVKQWQGPELAGLRQVCERHASDLSRGPKNSTGQTLIARIDALLKIIQSHPNLFVATAP